MIGDHLNRPEQVLDMDARTVFPPFEQAGSHIVTGGLCQVPGKKGKDQAVGLSDISFFDKGSMRRERPA